MAKIGFDFGFQILDLQLIENVIFAAPEPFWSRSSMDRIGVS